MRLPLLYCCEIHGGHCFSTFKFLNFIITKNLFWHWLIFILPTVLMSLFPSWSKFKQKNKNTLEIFPFRGTLVELYRVDRVRKFLHSHLSPLFLPSLSSTCMFQAIEIIGICSQVASFFSCHWTKISDMSKMP